MTTLHIILLTCMILGAFVFGILSGIEWERASQEEQRELKEKEKNMYNID